MRYYAPKWGVLGTAPCGNIIGDMPWGLAIGLKPSGWPVALRHCSCFSSPRPRRLLQNPSPWPGIPQCRPGPLHISISPQVPVTHLQISAYRHRRHTPTLHGQDSTVQISSWGNSPCTLTNLYTRLPRHAPTHLSARGERFVGLHPTELSPVQSYKLWSRALQQE